MRVVPRPWSFVLLVLSPSGCGGAESSDAETGTTTTSGDATTTTTSESSSGADESSTGGIPEACPDVALETGIVGVATERTCEILADCVTPQVGIPLAAYAENPQVGGSPTEPGTLMPGATPLGELNTGVAGRYEFQLPAGSYHVCATEGAMVLCSGEIVLSEDDPVVFASYQSGIAYHWTVISCGL